jgi:hypothetical protein
MSGLTGVLEVNHFADFMLFYVYNNPIYLKNTPKGAK